jgi:hypothetical protein
VRAVTVWQVGQVLPLIAVIEEDLTETYQGRLPVGVSVDPGERLIIIPRSTIIAAKADIPDA